MTSLLLRSLALLPCAALLTAHAQTIVTDSVDAAGLMELLQGAGVVLSAPMLNGSNGAHMGAGTFTSAGDTLPPSGVVLATGDVNEVQGTADGFSSDDLDGEITVPDMEELLGDNTSDLAILEFDAVPEHGLLLVDFQFGSEEYAEFVCSSYDGMAIFVDGPGIEGSFSNDAVNIATVPGTPFPVGMNFIHGGLNDDPDDPTCPAQNIAYYLNNELGTQCVFDGLTVRLTGACIVIPGEHYHVRIIVADGSFSFDADTGYDSGVFLPAQGVRSVTGTLGTACVADLDLVSGWFDAFGRLQLRCDRMLTAVHVLDGLGRQVAEAAGGDIQAIDVPALPNGLYFVRAFADGRWLTGRVFKATAF